MTYLLPEEEARVTLIEAERLRMMKYLTMMIDGWDDRVRRSIYGSLVSQLGERPIILGLADLTGERSTANKIVEISDESLKNKSVKPTDVIAIVTDNPTTMKAVCRKWTEKYPWVLVRTDLVESNPPSDRIWIGTPMLSAQYQHDHWKNHLFPLVKATIAAAQ